MYLRQKLVKPYTPTPAPFKAGQCVYVGGWKYKVIACTHTHVQVEGLEKALPIRKVVGVTSVNPLIQRNMKISKMPLKYLTCGEGKVPKSIGPCGRCSLVFRVNLSLKGSQ